VLVTLELTERQAEHLKDIIDNWIDGCIPATDDVINDRSLTDVDDLLRAVDGMHEMFSDAVDLRQQLWMALART
jgi:hypothetical protein